MLLNYFQIQANIARLLMERDKVYKDMMSSAFTEAGIASTFDLKASLSSIERLERNLVYLESKATEFNQMKRSSISGFSTITEAEACVNYLAGRLAKLIEIRSLEPKDFVHKEFQRNYHLEALLDEIYDVQTKQSELLREIRKIRAAETIEVSKDFL